MEITNNDCNVAQHTYTVEQIAKILSVSVRKAHYLCDETDGFIVKRLGKRCLRINKESFDNWFKLNNLMLEKLDRLKAMQEDMIENIFGDGYQDNQLIICQPNGRPLLPEQLNRKFKDVIIEMREDGHTFASVPENLLDEVVFHSVRTASATKKMQVSNGNIKAVMTAGGWAEPDMVIRYSKAYEQDQVDIVNQMEDDYRKSEKTNPSLDTEKLLRIIQDNPELIGTILSTLPVAK